MSSKRRLPEQSGPPPKIHRRTSPEARESIIHRPPTLTHSDYTVAIICAVQAELAACTAMLDEEHPDLSSCGQDSNIYTLGRMGQHNVVIAGLPHGAIGTAPAATTARDLLRSFPQVRFGLMVGVGGGAPGEASPDTPEKDIRLGDVVVSSPLGRNGGVIQYDFGKTIGEGEFVPTGALNRPPAVLMAAVTKLRARHLANPNQIPAYIKDKLSSKPQMEKSFQYPGADKDQLFQADYCHVNGKPTCTACDAGRMVPRGQRSTNDPVIHYGTIGSANQVMRDGVTRERLRRQQGIMCFEMESAGLMNDFPCLVIRGICDYADTHKTKLWQAYAAAVAAGYAKELLGVVPLLSQEPVAAKLMKELSRDVRDIKAGVSIISENVDNVRASQEAEQVNQLADWLCPENPKSTLHSKGFNRQHGTGNWFLTHSSFLTWRDGIDNKNLFCPGLPGSGKTILAVTVIDHLRSLKEIPGSFQDLDVAVVHFFCDYKFTTDSQDKPSKLLASLLGQLVSLSARPPPAVWALYHKHSREMTMADIREQLLSILKESFDRLYIIIDALDEWNVTPGERGYLLREIYDLQKSHDIRLMTTFRDQTQIYPEPEGPTCSVKAHKEDVVLFLREQIHRLPLHVQQDQVIQQRIIDRISALFDGSFLIARLCLEALMDKNSRTCTLQVLEGMWSEPGGLSLSQAYGRVMSRIEDQRPGDRQLAMRGLFWIVSSKRLLTVDELQHALAIRPGMTALSEDDTFMIETLIASCHGLVVVDQVTKTVRLMHHTADEYLQTAYLETLAGENFDIASGCLTYLSMDIFAEGYCATAKLLEARLNRYPFMIYASEYWAEHMRDAPPVASELAFTFLQNPAKSSSSSQVLWKRQSEIKVGSQSIPADFFGLHLAAYFGLHSLLIKLLETTAPMNQSPRDSLGRTPLSYAAENGHLAVVQVLLDCNIDTNRASTGGMTPLTYALEKKHFAVLELLVARGAHIDFVYSPQTSKKRTPLSRATEKGEVAVVRLFLDHQSDPNLEDEHGQTPLVRGLEKGHGEVVKLLLAKGAKVDFLYTFHRLLRVRQGNGRITRTLAVDTWNFEFHTSKSQDRFSEYTLLLHHGLDTGSAVEVRDIDTIQDPDDALKDALIRASAEHFEFSKNRNVDCLRGPEERQLELHSLKRSPLSRAAEKGELDICQQLVNQGAVLRLGDEQAETPLFRAAKNGHDAVVEFLLNKDAAIGTLRERGSAVLQVALKGRDSAFGQDRSNPESVSQLRSYNTIISNLLEHSYMLDAQDESCNLLLLFAAETGNESIVMHLLETRSADVNCTNKSNQTPLCLAADNGHERVVQLLTDHGGRLTVSGLSEISASASPLLSAAKVPPGLDASDFSAMAVAIADHNDAVIDLLLTLGMDSNTPEGQYLLMEAAMKGNDKRVRLLLDNGASPNKTLAGPPAIYRAATHGHDSIVQDLLAAGADPTLRWEDNTSPITQAATSGHYGVVKLLLENGVNPDSEDGQIALFLAASEGHEAVVRMLLLEGASNHTKTETFVLLILAALTGRTAVARFLLYDVADFSHHEIDELYGVFNMAVYNGHHDIAKLFLEFLCAELVRSQLPGSDLSPLWLAARRGHYAVLKLLLEHGADPNYQTQARLGTPLMLLAWKGNSAAVSLLLENGANPNHVAPKFPYTALIAAAYCGHDVVVQLLLDHHADPSYGEDVEGGALLWAAARGHSVIVRLLCQAGANPNKPHRHSRTPLMAAAAGGHFEAVRALLAQESIEREARDDWHHTAAACAQSAGHMEIFKLLHGIDTRPPNPRRARRNEAVARIDSPFCDICLRIIPDGDMYYHCPQCDDGAFALCDDCYRYMGEGCLVPSHEVVERTAADPAVAEPSENQLVLACLFRNFVHCVILPPFPNDIRVYVGDRAELAVDAAD
ncbi:hypothetical protein AbraIFM66951_002829 [Aspergillus brasiliensis]|uniref:Nucleoside phosphorylase domain-containing protein n=1 Tax=Aspergillus brasiliensis TaxID=319629 RepID=A0A9W5YY25_9EURO|nr:hypothetical protein AbraCBS73388_001639 [Aspergillus brasiliensis]GKZ49984.1 hypothetical protein AbraIFM66951_002829 [Aspergillus brasiliensis]